MSNQDAFTAPDVLLIFSRYRLFVALAVARAGVLLSFMGFVVAGVPIPLTEDLLTILEIGIQIAQFAGWLALLSAVESHLDSVRRGARRSWSDDMVFSYFVPFANLYRPALTLRDAVVDLSRRAGHMRAPEASVFAFWATWIVHGIVGRLLEAEANGVWYAFIGMTVLLLLLEVLIASEMRTLVVAAGPSPRVDIDATVEAFR